MITADRILNRSYADMLLPAKGLPGIESQIRRAKENPLSAGEQELLLQMLQVVGPAVYAPDYYYQVLYFIRRFTEMQSTKHPESSLEFLLIDLTDYCVGLPATNAVLSFFTEAYEKHSSPRLKVAAAECVGYMRSGLPRATQMFIPLLRAWDSQSLQRTVEAIGRTLGVQSRLAELSVKWGKSCEDVHDDAVRGLVALRRELFRLSETKASISGNVLADLLVRTRCISNLDLLEEAHRRDAVFFVANQERLLRDHKGEWVAIRNGEILGFAASRKRMDEVIRNSVGPDVNVRVLVERITPAAFHSKASVISEE